MEFFEPADKGRLPIYTQEGLINYARSLETEVQMLKANQERLILQNRDIHWMSQKELTISYTVNAEPLGKKYGVEVKPGYFGAMVLDKDGDFVEWAIYDEKGERIFHKKLGEIHDD